MAITAITPRDRLQRIIDLGRKALRYWWLIALLGVVGGALSMVLASKRPKKFQSWSTIFYQERIQSSLLSPGREEVVQRNIGDKYREILLARTLLAQVVTDPAVSPFPPGTEVESAIDSLRGAIKLEGRGGNAFRINYTDGDPDRAKAVTEKLTKLLQEKDESLRNQQARDTVAFATQQKEEAETKLKKDVEALTVFLSQHPEFAADPNSSGEGVSIRARQNAKETPATPAKNLSPEQERLFRLERQRQRIQDTLNAPPGTAPPPVIAPKTPERIAADARVAEAQREIASAKREVEDALTKYTPKHPTAIKAQEKLDLANQHLRDAQAQVPQDAEPQVAPASPEDRKKLERQLEEVDQQIARLRNAKPAAPGAPPPPPITDTTSWIVRLETDHAELRRRVNEQRERVNSLADSVFRSELDARQKLAETGGRLNVVDPAFKPAASSGPGKKVFLMGGVVLFFAIGFAIAVVLAVIDDRLYRRADLDNIGVVVLGVIPPGPKQPKQGRSLIARKIARKKDRAEPTPATKDAA